MDAGAHIHPNVPPRPPAKTHVTLNHTARSWKKSQSLWPAQINWHASPRTLAKDHASWIEVRFLPFGRPTQLLHTNKLVHQQQSRHSQANAPTNRRKKKGENMS
jgi:hypothetical protein